MSKQHLFLKLHDKNDRAKGMKEIKENSKLVKKKKTLVKCDFTFLNVPEEHS